MKTFLILIVCMISSQVIAQSQIDSNSNTKVLAARLTPRAKYFHNLPTKDDYYQDGNFRREVRVIYFNYSTRNQLSIDLIANPEFAGRLSARFQRIEYFNLVQSNAKSDVYRKGSLILRISNDSLELEETGAGYGKYVDKFTVEY